MILSLKLVLLLVCLVGVPALLASAYSINNGSDHPGKKLFVLLEITLAVLLLIVTLRNINDAIVPTDLIKADDVIRGSLINTLLILFGGFTLVYTGRGPALDRKWGIWFGILWGGYLGTELAVGLAIDLGILHSGLVQIRRLVFTFAHMFGLVAALYGTFNLGTEIYNDRTRTTVDALLAVCGFAIILVDYFIIIGMEVAVSGEQGSVVGPVFLAGTAFAILGLQIRYRPFESTPKMGHLARDSAFSTMNEAVIVVDDAGALVDANSAAQSTFGMQLSEAVGRSIEDVFGQSLGQEFTDPVSLDTPNGRRSFLISCSALDDEEGTQVGHAYVFRDVTDEQTREQQLEVFNRVLRHNLRNDLDAIRGFAETLDEEDDGGTFDTETVAQRIESLSSDLSKTGETAKRAEQIRTKEQLGQEELTVSTFFDSIETEIEERFPNCRLALSPPRQLLRIQTDREVLRTVLLEVIENAIEHIDDPKPAVQLSARATDEGVEFAVRDEGEGIPEHEREVLLEGKPSQLQHGAGIGLWLVSWGVTRLGGELSLEDADTGGAIVRFSIPDRRSDPSEHSDHSGSTTYTASADSR